MKGKYYVHQYYLFYLEDQQSWFFHTKFIAYISKKRMEFTGILNVTPIDLHSAKRHIDV